MSDMLAMLLGAGSDKTAQVLAGLGGKSAHGSQKGDAVGQAGELAGLAAAGLVGGSAGTGVAVEPFEVLLSGRIEALQAKGDAGVADPLLTEAEAREAQPGVPVSDPSGFPAGLLPGAGVLVPGVHGRGGGSAAAGVAAVAESTDTRFGGKQAQSRAAVLAALRQSLPQEALGRAGEAPGGKGDFSIVSGVGDSQVNGSMMTLSGAVAKGAGMPTATGSLVQVLAAPLGGAGAEISGLVPAGQPSALMPGVAGAAPADSAPRGVTPLQVSIDAPLRSSQFSQELGDRVVWLASRQGHVAEVALNPPHLGPLEVRLSLNGSEAGAQFYSPHAAVRDAIEAALPRLKEMLADAGVTLGQTQVRDEALPRQPDQAQSGQGRDRGTEADASAPDPGGLALHGGSNRLLGQGLVDLYI
ncbi:MAG: flagellar hook-length control protein FliK [Pseudomonadota bacterium]